MANQPAPKKAKRVSAPLSAPVPTAFHLTPLELAEIGQRANEVSKANAKNGNPSYFVGLTVHGHGLIETDTDGNVCTHYGTRDELLAILNA